MRVELEHVLPHPADRVFAVVSDPARRHEWQESTSDVEVLTPGPPGVGTRWRETQKGVGRVEAECVGYERDALWAESGLTSAGTAHVTVTFQPDGNGGTRVTMDVEIALRGLKRAFDGVLAPMVRHQLPKDLARLGELLDREGA